MTAAAPVTLCLCGHGARFHTEEDGCTRGECGCVVLRLVPAVAPLPAVQAWRDGAAPVVVPVVPVTLNEGDTFTVADLVPLPEEGVDVPAALEQIRADADKAIGSIDEVYFPYPCPDCPRRFRTAQAVGPHRRKAHGFTRATVAGVRTVSQAVKAERLAREAAAVEDGSAVPTTVGRLASEDVIDVSDCFVDNQSIDDLLAAGADSTVPATVDLARLVAGLVGDLRRALDEERAAAVAEAARKAARNEAMSRIMQLEFDLEAARAALAELDEVSS